MAKKFVLYILAGLAFFFVASMLNTPQVAASFDNSQPTNDTWTRSDQPNNNYGTNVELTVGAGTYNVWLRFDLSGFTGTIENAKLYLAVTAKSGAAWVGFYRSENTDWDENVLTYANTPDPAYLGTLLDNVYIATGIDLYSWDVTAAAQAAQAVDNLLTLVAPDNGMAHYISFSSKEGATPPYLEICSGMVVENVTTDNTLTLTLMDRDADYSGSGAKTSVEIETVVTCFSGVTNIVHATVTVYDNTSTVIVDNAAFTSSEDIDSTHRKYFYTFDCPDACDNMGTFDIRAEVMDVTGDENSKTYYDSLLGVDDMLTTISFSPTLPYNGFDITGSGTISRAYGTASADNAWLIDNKHGTFVLGSGNSWSKAYQVSGAPGENCSVCIRILDSPLDGVVCSSYLLNTSIIYQVELRYENTYALVPEPDVGAYGENIGGIENRNIWIKFFWDNGSYEVKLENSQENVFVSSGGQVIRWARLYDNSLYWRARIPNENGGIINFFLFTPDEIALGLMHQFTFSLTDLTGMYGPTEGYSGGQFLVKKWIENNYAEINDTYWDSGFSTTSWLLLNDSYQLATRASNAPYRVLGPLVTYVTSDYSRVIQISSIDILDTTTLFSGVAWTAWRYNENIVKVYYQDNLEETISSSITIYDNLGNSVLDSVIDNSWFLVTWSAASPSRTYMVNLSAEHSTYGSINVNIPISLPGENYAYVHTDEGTPSNLPIPIASIVALIITLAVGLAFDAPRAPLAALGMALTATFLFAVGWLDILWYTCVLVIMIAVLFALGRRRSK